MFVAIMAIMAISVQAQGLDEFLAKVILIKNKDLETIAFIKGEKEKKVNLSISVCEKYRGDSAGAFYGAKDEAFTTYNRTTFSFDCKKGGILSVNIFQTENNMRFSVPFDLAQMTKDGYNIYLKGDDVFLRIEMRSWKNMYLIYGLYKTYPFILNNSFGKSKENMPKPIREEL